jgi:hypothetical protein
MEDDNKGNVMVKDRTNADKGGEHSQLPTLLTTVEGVDSRGGQQRPSQTGRVMPMTISGMLLAPFTS